MICKNIEFQEAIGYVIFEESINLPVGTKPDGEKFLDLPKYHIDLKKEKTINRLKKLKDASTIMFIAAENEDYINSKREALEKEGYKVATKILPNILYENIKHQLMVR